MTAEFKISHPDREIILRTFDFKSVIESVYHLMVYVTDKRIEVVSWIGFEDAVYISLK